jgi:hypothetical protein
MRITALIFALLLPATAFAAESSKPPMVQNAVTPQNGYVFQQNTGPEGGGRWTRTAPHPAALQNYAGSAGQGYADPAQVTQAPPADINADAPEVSEPVAAAPATPAPAPAPAPVYRDPNPPVQSTGGGSWSLPQAELDAMAGRPVQNAPAQAQQQLPPQNGMQMQSFTVTSVEKCLSQLPPAEAAEIRARYVKPYEECNNRVMSNTRAQKTIEAGKQQEALTPETPRNYIRVAVPQGGATTAPSDTNTSDKRESSGKSYIDISGSAKPALNP